METLIIFFIIEIIFTPIVLFWINSIDYMDKNHPEYKGEDLI
jgi:hypothetical protein